LQVEKFLRRYEILCAEGSEQNVRAGWTLPERQIADEFLSHARAIRKERADAADAGREPHVLELLKSWGGVTVAYRKRLIDSPSYTLNHEEIEKALEEGIRFAENVAPAAVVVDDSVRKRTVGECDPWARRRQRRNFCCHTACAHGARCGRHAAQHRFGARRRTQLRAGRALLPGL
jgi:hypothetical protein